MLLINSAYTLMTYIDTLNEYGISVDLADLTDNATALATLAELGL